MSLALDDSGPGLLNIYADIRPYRFIMCLHLQQRRILSNTLSHYSRSFEFELIIIRIIHSGVAAVVTSTTDVIRPGLLNILAIV